MQILTNFSFAPVSIKKNENKTSFLSNQSLKFKPFTATTQPAFKGKPPKFRNLNELENNLPWKILTAALTTTIATLLSRLDIQEPPLSNENISEEFKSNILKLLEEENKKAEIEAKMEAEKRAKEKKEATTKYELECIERIKECIARLKGEVGSWAITYNRIREKITPPVPNINEIERLMHKYNIKLPKQELIENAEKLSKKELLDLLNKHKTGAATARTLRVTDTVILRLIHKFGLKKEKGGIWKEWKWEDI